MNLRRLAHVHAALQVSAGSRTKALSGVQLFKIRHVPLLLDCASAAAVAVAAAVR